MPKTTNENAEIRLSIRTSRTQKALLARAASASHMNVSQFVLGASLREAEHVVDAETRITVSAEEYDWLIKLMDGATPSTPKPRLREALDQKPVWDV
jgi:uncharacterized protein (DUF1778 family)